LNGLMNMHDKYLRLTNSAMIDQTSTAMSFGVSVQQPHRAHSIRIKLDQSDTMMIYIVSLPMHHHNYSYWSRRYRSWASFIVRDHRDEDDHWRVFQLVHIIAAAPGLAHLTIGSMRIIVHSSIWAIKSTTTSQVYCPLNAYQCICHCNSSLRPAIFPATVRCMLPTDLYSSRAQVDWSPTMFVCRRSISGRLYTADCIHSSTHSTTKSIRYFHPVSTSNIVKHL
jgi:hypothetical protein